MLRWHSVLHNGQIDVMLRLAKAEELKPILTPRQELEKMQQQNPSIAKLIEQLGLQIRVKHYTKLRALGCYLPKAYKLLV